MYFPLDYIANIEGIIKHFLNCISTARICIRNDGLGRFLITKMNLFILNN